MNDNRYDVAIVGAGFAGSILARVLNRQGRRVLLLERGEHPRFAIGESTTPLANFALERLAHRYDLPDLYHLSTHGRWLAHLPHLRRGLKRGFTFYRHARGEPYRNSAANEARLLVAASPGDAIADTHWLRADVDHHLAERAAAEGVDLRQRTEVEDLEISAGGVELAAESGGRRSDFAADIVVDAGGPGSVVARALRIPSAIDRAPIASGLLYSHFEGLRPFGEVARAGGAVLDPGPYPDERAAVHHLLDEGWLYVLPFDHGVASAGVILRHGREHQPGGRTPVDEIRRDPAAAWEALIGRYPSLAEQFAGGRPIEPIRYVERMQHRLGGAAGERWFLLPHAFAFFDPLFSTGMAWSLLAVERLATIFEGGYGDAPAYDRLLEREADQLARLMEAAYLAMGDFELFTAVAFLYFAAVTFAEVRQRLLTPGPGEPPAGWEGFLGAGDVALRDLYEGAAERLRRGEPAAEVRDFILRGIEPYNVAGLADPRRRNLYPVDFEVLVERAGLLGLDRESAVAALPRLRGEPALPLQ
jgi:FADH2 O2-dependent halogenase